MPGSHLTEREVDVWRWRVVAQLTLEETAEALKITRERVRQIEAKIFRKLGKLTRETLPCTAKLIEKLYDP